MSCCTIVTSGYTIFGRIVGFSTLPAKAAHNYRTEQERVHILNIDLRLLKETTERLRRCVSPEENALDDTFAYVDTLLLQASAILDDINVPPKTSCNWKAIWGLVSKLRGSKIKQANDINKTIEGELNVILLFLCATKQLQYQTQLWTNQRLVFRQQVMDESHDDDQRSYSRRHRVSSDTVRSFPVFDTTGSLPEAYPG